MAADDFYTFAARERLQRINAERSRARAELEEAKASGDSYAAGDAEEAIAQADMREQALVALHQRYVASQAPPPEPPELTPEEKFAKPWDRMDWQDGLDLARTSKYGKDLDHTDPNVVAGYAEVTRRRQRGE
jgi:hypothetical protein